MIWSYKIANLLQEKKWRKKYTKLKKILIQSSKNYKTIFNLKSKNNSNHT